MNSPHSIFDFILRQRSQGKRVVLVTVIAVTGASVRNPGANMAVTEDGLTQGSLSGGCIEAAVAAEALIAMKENAPRQQRYGAGSPIIDIRLPCGGTVDLLFTPVGDVDPISSLLSRFADRSEGKLSLTLPNNRYVTVTYAPPLRLCILGHGGTVEALTRLADSIGAPFAVFTPDPDIALRLGADAMLMSSAGQPVALHGDPWTAFAFLFHDHDWEYGLLQAALDQPALMIGAMGSHKTHAARLAQLRSLGCPDDHVARIKSPIGLIPSSRDPETLALSILAEAVAAYNATDPVTLCISDEAV